MCLDHCNKEIKQQLKCPIWGLYWSKHQNNNLQSKVFTNRFFFISWPKVSRTHWLVSTKYKVCSVEAQWWTIKQLQQTLNDSTRINHLSTKHSYILDWTLDSGSKGYGFDSHQCLSLFVLQQDTFSTLLLSTQVYKWVYPVGNQRYLLHLMWHVCAPEVAPGHNAPQGAEKVHYECSCRIDIESSDRGNNTL